VEALHLITLLGKDKGAHFMSEQLIDEVMGFQTSLLEHV